MSEETYYKAVRPDGTDFYSGKVAWDRVGEIVEHPNPGKHNARGYFSVSVSPTDCAGMKWPCRLFVVEPVEGTPVWKPDPSLPSKRASHAWRVVRELPAHKALGPNGAEVAAFLELLPTLTSTQLEATGDAAACDTPRFPARIAACDTTRVPARIAAWDATWDATRVAARDAAGRAAWAAIRIAARAASWDATRIAAEDAAGIAADDAAGALLARDLISTTHYEILTEPMRAAGIDFNALTAAGTKSDGPAETEDDNKKEPQLEALQSAIHDQIARRDGGDN